MQSIQASRLTIYLGNARVHRHRSVAEAILLRARSAGLRGVSTLHGIEGFGHSGRLHVEGGWRIVDRAPATVHIVDTAERITAFLPVLDEFAGECVVVRDDVVMLVPDGEVSVGRGTARRRR